MDSACPHVYLSRFNNDLGARMQQQVIRVGKKDELLASRRRIAEIDTLQRRVRPDRHKARCVSTIPWGRVNATHPCLAHGGLLVQDFKAKEIAWLESLVGKLRRWRRWWIVHLLDYFDDRELLAFGAPDFKHSIPPSSLPDWHDELNFPEQQGSPWFPGCNAERSDRERAARKETASQHEKDKDESLVFRRGECVHNRRHSRLGRPSATVTVRHTPARSDAALLRSSAATPPAFAVSTRRLRQGTQQAERKRPPIPLDRMASVH